MFTIGVDIGGTFTDVVLFNEESGDILVSKVPSTPADRTQGFKRGIEGLSVPMSEVQRVVHGTTVATNAAIERKGAKTALVTTQGFRDVLEIGRGMRLLGGLFDPNFVRPKHLVPRPLRFEVRERVNYTGKVLQPLAREDIEAVSAQMRDLEIEAIAVCFLHSYVNSTHEQEALEYLSGAHPQAFLCTSSDVLPEYREYERLSTTVFNAYLGPMMRRYVTNIANWLASEGYRRDLLIMTCNGGMASAEVAASYPIRTVLSGPAGGVSGGIFVGEALGVKNVITYDMGGTSTDVCLVKDLQPLSSSLRMVGGLPLKTPQMDINTIGAGGGSIAWVDKDGSFRVGPQSAGADPGPACYGMGGEFATVTDANLLLNRIGVDTMLGGRLTLQRDLAHRVLVEVGERMGLQDVYRVAEGVVEVAVANMTSALREISIEKGEDPRDFVLIPFGGAGPMHACLLAAEVGIPKVVVPNYPGNLSALGLLTSDLKHEFVHTHLTSLSKADLSQVKTLFQSMKHQGEEILLKEGIPQERMEFRYSMDMRYLGQAHELNVPVEPQQLEIQELEALFHRRYLEMYSYSREGQDVELVNLRVVALGMVPKLSFRPLGRDDGKTLAKAQRETRQVYFDGAFLETPVYERELLPPGAMLQGPAIVQEMGSNTVVFPQWRGQVDTLGNLVLEMEG